MIINNYLIIFGYYTSITFWVISILIYILKIFNDDFGTFTSYGKLKFGLNSKEKKENKNKINDNEQNSITSILNLFFLDKEIIDTKQAWMLFYTVLLVLSNLFFFILSEENDKSTSTQILFILFFIQAGRRLYETHFIQKHRKSDMNLLLFISGLCYYIFLTLSAFTETIYKINHSKSETISINIFNLLLSLLLFSIGSFEQFKSHEILSLIRSNKTNLSSSSTTRTTTTTNKNKTKNNILNNIMGFEVDDSSDEDDNDNDNIQNKNFDDKIEYKTTPSTKYEIPNGRLYQYVSSPHYLSEILIYFSFLILTNFKLNSLIVRFGFY
ncbi:hypothetical protein DDB_G0284423 [Dictyostelium discoideum AX4]|uniref:3-oxo-5-alpha-steroid 4-dehydrogenase C-terminal domain-containing protein n=1 Tax=Dictyostelium discoideum TaxID=44689 RepID=Q54PN2_DICDI|nr:hypothetical protein DDB_G0284423 [Dictyostelium discoideum AX4]EAL65260.1 hypothetical protein DDB_G0284423 [Dictyostelium discoideum AX4]|eukprot:XP_638622.1 hypothetical protein DDB_G0284423 [Dictyostelium discoideum AX4]